MNFFESFEMLVNPVLDLKDWIDDEYEEFGGFTKLFMLVPYLGFVFAWLSIYVIWHAVSIPLAIAISITTIPFE